MAKVKYKGKGFAGVKSGTSDRKHWADQLDPVRFTSQYANKSVLLRLVSDIFPEGTHWIYTNTDDIGKNSFEGNLKGKRFMVVCPDWNPEEEKSSKTTCYCCMHLSSSDMLGGVKVNWYVQAYLAKTKNGKIIKKDGKIKWEDEPEVIVLPTSAITEIQKMMETVGNGVEPQDRKHGYSIWLTYSNSGKGKASWSCQKDSEVSFKELGMDKDAVIDFGEYYEATPAKDIDESMERLGYVDLVENGGKKKKSKSVDDDDDDDDDDEDEDNILGDDDEDEKPSKKKKSKKDDDDDEDDDDEDEDEKPSKKKSKKKDDVDDDDDDDEDSDDDDDDEDEKPSKKKGKKGKFDEDDDDDDDDDEDSDDDDDDDEDSDDDDEKPSKKKSKKSKFDEDEDGEDDDDEDKDDDDEDEDGEDDDDEDNDDEDEDDEDEDDDDEDEKPSKKKKKSKKFDDDDDDEDEKPSKKKKKSKKFDDDDDD